MVDDRPWRDRDRLAALLQSWRNDLVGRGLFLRLLVGETASHDHAQCIHIVRQVFSIFLGKWE